MKFWLACFLLLFVGAELLEWVMHIAVMGDSVQASGSWLILGGMGLAAASNAKHLPKAPQVSATPDKELASHAHESGPSESGPSEAVIEDTAVDNLSAQAQAVQFQRAQQNGQENSLQSETSEGDADVLDPDVSDDEDADGEEIRKEDAILFEMRMPWW